MSAIEDRLAINDLFVRYTTALDAGDVETVVGCFTADAVLESPAIGVIAGQRRSAPLPAVSRRCARVAPSSAT